MTRHPTGRLPGTLRYDVYRTPFPFGLREWLGRIEAPTRAKADELAAHQFGAGVLVVLAYGTTRQAAKSLEERLALKRSGRAPHHRRKKP